jgi:O-acetyl-ADP-ribose deacetylase (regulator of RNase III)
VATIEVFQGDITALNVDAVVNAANSALAGGGGVDGAIHRAAGYEQLQAICRKLGGCQTGQVKVTPGFNLPAQYIFHAVGPIWRGGQQGEPEFLASCYRQAMIRAKDYNLSSIAFPAISCGVYGYPVDEAVTIAVDTVRAFLPESGLDKVIFCCFSSDMSARYKRLLTPTGCSSVASGDQL